MRNDIPMRNGIITRTGILVVFRLEINVCGSRWILRSQKGREEYNDVCQGLHQETKPHSVLGCK